MKMKRKRMMVMISKLRIKKIIMVIMEVIAIETHKIQHKMDRNKVKERIKRRRISKSESIKKRSYTLKLL